MSNSFITNSQQRYQMGCTAADFIFSLFLLTVGFSIAIASSKSLDGESSKKELLLKRYKGSIIIFTLSLFPNFNFSEFRIPEVLQRIGLVYFVCSSLYLFADKTKLAGSLFSEMAKRYEKNIL